jgi:hypothetical protein
VDEHFIGKPDRAFSEWPTIRSEDGFHMNRIAGAKGCYQQISLEWVAGKLPDARFLPLWIITNLIKGGKLKGTWAEEAS